MTKPAVNLRELTSVFAAAKASAAKAKAKADKKKAKEEAREAGKETDDEKRDNQRQAVGFIRALRLTRDTTKRTTMTTPYGIPEFTAHQHVEEGLKKNGDLADFQDLPKNVQKWVRVILGRAVYRAVGTAVQASQELKIAFQGAGRKYADANAQLTWTMPDGVRIRQDVWQWEEKADLVRIQGKPIAVNARTFKTDAEGNRLVDKADAASGASPNIVHSFDAYHMRRVINRMKREYPECSLWMIHDSFGCDYYHGHHLKRIVREEFAAIHRDAPLIALCAELGIDQIELGDWNPDEVLGSTWAFA